MPVAFARAHYQLESIPWQPQVDVYRCERRWVIKMELAGVRPDDLWLGVVEGRLVVEGKRCDSLIKATWQHYTMEIAYDHFRRVIALPIVVDGADVSSVYRDGMLIITVTPRGGRHGGR